MYKVTATQKGYIVAIVYQSASSERDACEIAALSIAGKFDSIRAELIEENQA